MCVLILFQFLFQFLPVKVVLATSGTSSGSHAIFGHVPEAKPLGYPSVKKLQRVTFTFFFAKLVLGYSIWTSGVI